MLPRTGRWGKFLQTFRFEKMYKDGAMLRKLIKTCRSKVCIKIVKFATYPSAERWRCIQDPKKILQQKSLIGKLYFGHCHVPSNNLYFLTLRNRWFVWYKDLTLNLSTFRILVKSVQNFSHNYNLLYVNIIMEWKWNEIQRSTYRNARK